jgi:hypothetical protein
MYLQRSTLRRGIEETSGEIQQAHIDFPLIFSKMHMIRPVLLVYINTLCCLFYVGSTSTKAVPSAQLLPNGSHALGEYDVVSIREEDDEDVVQLRKRVNQEDSPTDCLDYSGSPEGEPMQCAADDGVNDEDDEDALDRRSLWKRAGRKPEFPWYVSRLYEYCMIIV